MSILLVNSNIDKIGVTYFGSEVVFMFAADEGPSETMLQVSRWLAFTGKFFISGAFSVRHLKG